MINLKKKGVLRKMHNTPSFARVHFGLQRYEINDNFPHYYGEKDLVPLAN